METTITKRTAIIIIFSYHRDQNMTIVIIVIIICNEKHRKKQNRTKQIDAINCAIRDLKQKSNCKHVKIRMKKDNTLTCKCIAQAQLDVSKLNQNGCKMDVICKINNKISQDNSSMNRIARYSIKKDPYSIKAFIAQSQHIQKMILIIIMTMMMMTIRV